MKKIDIREIKKSRFNVRREYDLESMNISEGYTHRPIVVPTEEEHYEILVGHRRVEKARNEGLAKIECEVREGLTDKEVIKEQARENLQRKGWTPIEEGMHFEIQRRFGLSVRKIADNIKKSERYVQLRLFLLQKLNTDIANSVRYSTHDPNIDTRSITFHKALELARLPEKDQKILSDLIKNRGLTTRELRERIQNRNNVEKILEQEEVNAEVMENYYLTVDQVKELKEKYYPLKFEKHSVKKLLNEISDIRKKTYREERPRVVFLPKKHNDLFPSYSIGAEGFTEEEAKEYAKKHRGEFIGEETFSFWNVFVVEDEGLNLRDYPILVELEPIKIQYSKKRCEKCGRLLEERMNKQLSSYCANCFSKAKKKARKSGYL